ncbi:esterase [Mycobacterium sp. NPDC050441]|uniref:esterase n=1 Tax=Mycobacterium sp. NPDC050441 TaxID=3155403 RepID=UPI0033C98D68
MKIAIVATLSSATILLAAPGVADAESACTALGGTVDADGVCTSHTVTPRYKLDISFPVDYPDQQAVTEFVDGTRTDWNHAADAYPVREFSYLLTIAGSAYHSGPPQAGTRSLVFALNSDFGAHPVTSFHALNYDLGKGAPITLATLFKPGTDPVRLLAPIVKRELDRRGLGGDASVDDLNAQDFEQFAISDEALTFFFAQGLVGPQVDGPQRITVSRSELASVLA